MVYTKEEAKKNIKKFIEFIKKRIKEKGEKHYNEEQTCKDFILPLFRYLNWDIENRHNDEVLCQFAIRRKRADYLFLIDGIKKFFLEAKKVNEDICNSFKANKQIVQYSWNMAVSWGVLTNAKEIIIFYCDLKTSNPFQNARIIIRLFEDFDDKTFEDLWLLSKDSFQEDLLDKVAERHGLRKVRKRIDIQLLDDLKTWRAKLVDNIKKHSIKNRGIYKEELLKIDEIVLKFLNRLIFMRSCEDRNYENKELSILSRWYEDNKIKSLLEELRKVFKKYWKRYDSNLFEESYCDYIYLDDDIIYEIINGLYETRDKKTRHKISEYYFNIIPADSLGIVYENYLGFILKQRKKDIKSKKSYLDRKKHGIYYTPTYIVEYIINETLGKLLNSKKININEIKVLDLACGSGSFLIKAYDVIERYLKKVHKCEELPYEIKSSILTNNLYGVDLDHRACEITKLNLMLKAFQKDKILPSLNKNIKCGNSLINKKDFEEDKAFDWKKEFKEVFDENLPEKERGFNVIIGNPPYVQASGVLIKKESKELMKTRRDIEKSGNYITLGGRWDLFIPFIERGFNFLKKEGRMSYIVSDAIEVTPYSKKIRNFLIDNSSVEKIDFFPKVKLFRGVGISNTIFSIIKTKPSNLHKVERYKHFSIKLSDKETLPELNQLKERERIFLVDYNPKLENLKENTIDLGQICYVCGGAQLQSDQEKYRGEFIKDDLINDSRSSKFNKLYLEGKDLDRFLIKRIRYLDYDSKVKKMKRPRFKELFENKKLMFGGTSGFIYDENNIYSNHSIIICILWEDLKKIENKSINKSIRMLNSKFKTNLSKKDLVGISREFNLKYILGIISSKSMENYIRKNILKSKRTITEDTFKEVPIKKISLSQQEPLIKLVEKMISLKRELLKEKESPKYFKLKKEIEETENKINDFVCGLYNVK